MGKPEREVPVSLNSEHVVGEGFEADMRKPLALRTNRTLREMSESGMNAEIDLGEHGVHSVENVRFRDALKEGHLLAYTRQETGEHKVISTIIALGVVAAGLYGIRYRRKK